MVAQQRESCLQVADCHLVALRILYRRGLAHAPALTAKNAPTLCAMPAVNLKTKTPMSSHTSVPVRRRFAACIAILGVALVPVSHSLGAAATPSTPGGPTVTVNEPVAVTVAGPVEVQGVVEVINDVLRQPYRVSRQQLISVGRNTEVTFDVPTNKRLIIETISILAKVTENQSVNVSMSTPATTSGNSFVFFPIQKQGNFLSQDFFVAYYPTKLRVDGKALSDDIVFTLNRNSAAGAPEFTVSLFGYLVDIP